MERAERVRQIGRAGRRRKDSVILVKVSSLCIACCAIHFSDILHRVTDDREDEKEGCRR